MNVISSQGMMESLDETAGGTMSNSDIIAVSHRSLYYSGRHATNVDLVLMAAFIVLSILSCILWILHEVHTGPKREKEFAEAHMGATMAVANGRTWRPFEIGQPSTAEQCKEPQGSTTNANNTRVEETYVALEDEPIRGGMEAERETDNNIPARIPASGVYAISSFQGFHYANVPKQKRPAGKRRWSEIHLRFVPGSDGRMCGIFGEGTHRKGFAMGSNNRSANTTIVSGTYNAATGLAVWTERVDYEQACELPKGNPGHIPLRMTNKNTGRTAQTISSYISVLSHGRLDLEKGTFHGWYYAQSRNGEAEEKGMYEMFNLRPTSLNSIV